jgi:hypothetical protein
MDLVMQFERFAPAPANAFRGTRHRPNGDRWIFWILNEFLER